MPVYYQDVKSKCTFQKAKVNSLPRALCLRPHESPQLLAKSYINDEKIVKSFTEGDFSTTSTNLELYPDV